MALTPKQERFCQEYIVDLNATQAAIRAGYSEKTAGSQAHDHLKKPEICARIEELKEERARITGIDAQYVLRQAAKIHETCVHDGNMKDALRALEIIGKHTSVQAFKDVVRHEGGMTIVVDTGVPRPPDE